MFASAFYFALKMYCRLALQFFFRQWQVHVAEPLPRGPVILVANHQSAFMDAILVICSSFISPWSLARASIFEKSWAAKVLSLVKIKPIYRFRDGFSTLRKNEAAIEQYAQMLVEGKSLLIFAEGNDDGYWKLRPLQKGFAHIALRAEAKANNGLGVKIIPVSVQYEDHAKFRSRVLVTFGNAIAVAPSSRSSDATQLPKADENVNSLVEKTARALQSHMLHIEATGDAYENAVSFLKSHRTAKRNLIDQLEADQFLLSNVPNTGTTSTALHPNRRRWNWWNPLFLYAFLNHLPPIVFIAAFVKAKVHNTQFHSSIQYALGLVVVPVAYVMQAWVAYELTHSLMWTLVYFISLPISLSFVKRRIVV